jgi:hypothetical protein
MAGKTKPAVEAELTWPQVHAFRMRRHHLVPAGRQDLVKVAGSIGGAQAQVMSAAELQLAVRSGRPVTDVRKALWKDRTLVKTWLMRGTLHLIPAKDLPVYTAAMSGHWMRTRPSWLKYFGLTEAELMKLIETIGAALNGKPMTREEIIAIAGKGQPARVREWLKSGWGGFLKPVARAGGLCFGPSRGQSVTFVRPRDWIGGWRTIDPEVAIGEVARRYLRAFGPATKNDFVFWWGRWPGVANAAWSAIAPELTTVSVEGSIAQILTSDLERLPIASPGSVQLLPAFDPYLMGYASRDHLFDAVHRSKVSRTAGWISPVVLVDGAVVGTWSYVASGTTMRVSVQPFGRLAAQLRAKVKERAESLAASLGLANAELSVA